MGRPFISMGKDIDKTLKKFTYRNQIKEVRGLRAEFSKMNAGNERSMKRQETLAKIQRTRQIQAAKAPFQYAAKAYRQSEINQSFHSGMGGAGAFMGNNSALIGGNFASTVSTQMQAVTNAKNYAYQKYQDWKQAKEDKKQRAREEGVFSSQNTGTGVSGGSGGTNRGGFLSSVGSGVMVIEGLAKAAGFLVNMASNIAEQHSAAINSQAGTISATGGYVGGGGGLFANAEVARAQVEYNRAQGFEGTNKKEFGENLESTSRFAASQGLGLGQAAGAMGEIQRTSKDIRIEFIKGAAKASNIQGLKQGEFLTKFAEIVKQNREEGFGGLNSEGFLSMAAGISNKVATPERGLSIMGNLDKQAKMGDKGGIFGQLALVNTMSKNGGDFFGALAEKEKNGYTQDDNNAISGMMPKEIFGLLGRNEGMGSFTEMMGVHGSQGASIKENGIGDVVGNAALGRENYAKSKFAGMNGADELANKMQKDSFTMIEKIEPLLNKTIDVVGRIEGGLADASIKSIDKLEEIFKDVKQKGFEQTIKDAIKSAFQGVNLKDMLF